MQLNVNGATQSVASPPLATLLHVLREELGITSPKAGCQQGGCGACTVLVDGQPRRSCLTPLATVEGAEVTTVEGVGTPSNLSPVQAAFDRHYAAQCGFCTSGFVMATTALVEGGGGTSREEVIDALSGHLCRCTGYAKIVEAVTAAARGDVDAADAEVDRGPQEDARLIPGSPA